MQSKYHPVPIISKLKDIPNDISTLAIVGLPCHIHGIRKMEMLNLSLSKIIRLRIGLFCGINLNFLSIVHLAYRAANVEDLNKIEEIVYRAGEWPGRISIKLTSGKIVSLSIQEKDFITHIYASPRCTLCFDQTNEFADISIGDAWLPELINEREGHSIVISRTKQGQEILLNAQKAGYITLKEISAEKVINSQKPMMAFKKKTIFARLKLASIFRPVPEYTIEKQESIKPLVYNYLGALLLYFNISLAKYKFARNIIKILPSSILKKYTSIMRILLWR